MFGGGVSRPADSGVRRAHRQTKYSVEPFGGAVRRLSRFVNGLGRSWGRVFGVRRLLPLLDLLHWRPLAHCLLLLVCPTVNTTRTVKTGLSSGATGFYWYLLGSTLLAAASTVTLLWNYKSKPPESTTGCWTRSASFMVVPLWTEPEECDQVLTFYRDQNQRKDSEKWSQKVLQRSTGSFCCVLARKNLLNICFHQSDHDH